MISLCISSTPVYAASSSPLDGKTFVGQVGEKGKTTGDPDTFTFTAGKFDSIACHEYGYGDAPYTAKEGAFESTTTNTSGNKMIWKGTVKGDEISGTATMLSSDGAPQDEMWFKASLKR